MELLELAKIDRYKVLNGKLPLPKVIAVLRQLDFRILERPNRSPVAYLSVPQWFYNATGENSGWMNIRQLCDSALFQWDKYVNPNIVTTPITYIENATIESEDIRFYDDQILPTFGTATTFDPTIYSSNEPTDSPVEPVAQLAAPVVTLGTITATIKIVNPNGKFEITESSDSKLVPVGKTYNSTLTSFKPLGSLWIATCHLTRGDSGSLKIDSIEPFERITISPTVAAIPVPVVSTPTVAIEPLESPVLPTVGHSVTTANEPEPNRTITANLDEWLCADYYISPNARLVFKTAVNCLKQNSHNSVKVLMTGDPGYGKTTIAEKLAAFLGFTCYRMNCAIIRDTAEWFFDQEVKSKPYFDENGKFVGTGTDTVFTDSDFVQILARGNCVMILDEFNRLESNLHNSLFPLLDDSGTTRLHHKDYTVGPNVIFVATVNLGRDSSGTFLLDDALTNRFDMILEVRPLPYDHEIAVLKARYTVGDSDADEIVKLATILRENEFKCSTRDSLKIAKLVSVGMTIRDAFEFVVILRIPEDESNAPIRKALVDLVNKQLGTRAVEFAFQS